MEMQECKPVLRILSFYEQLSRKETPKRFRCSKTLTSISVFKDVRVLLLKQPILGMGICRREGYDIGIRNCIDLLNFGIRNGTHFQDFGVK